MNIFKTVRAFVIPAISLAAISATAADLTVYSHRHYPSDDKLFAQFEEQSGIKVKVVKASADELIERLKAESNNSPADLLITADVGRLERAKKAGLLQPVESEILTERIPANLRDPGNQWFGFTKRARVFVYAPDRVAEGELSTYEDLADKKWDGRLLIRSSSNIYNQSLLASMIAAHDEEKALEWAKAVRKNMVRPPQGSDRDQMRAVAAGLGDVAVVNTYYLGLLLNSDDAKDRKAGEALKVFFPNQDGRGSHINISGAGVTKSSKNVDAAVQFLEFLASDEAQQSFPQGSYEYPVVESVEWSEEQKSWGEFRADDVNLSILGDLNDEAVRTFNKAGWE